MPKSLKNYISDNLVDVAVEKAVSEEQKIHKEEVKVLNEEIKRLSKLLELDKIASSRRTQRTMKISSFGRGESKHGVPTSILSDLHLDEVVEPVEVFGVNKYNRKIAELRLEKYFEKAVTFPREYVSGLKYDGFCLFLGGDILSGIIHAELRNTNAATLADSIAYWVDPLSAGIALLAEEYGKVTVDCVVGNHGRNPLDRRSPAKHRAEDNFDFLVYKLIERDFRGDDRVDFNVSLSADTLRTVYTTRYLLTHGDQFRGGSGIAGLMSPMLLGTHRKQKRQSTINVPFDILVCGHWHQYIPAPSLGVIINHCLKGFDEYAFVSNFGYEDAKQALWITTPEHKADAFHVPIIVQDRKREGW